MDNGENCYRRFLDGDQSAFEELIEMYRESLIFFINGFLHNMEESEDVAEDAFVELLLHPHRYSFRSSFKTYLFSVARNKAVDRVRREMKFTRVPPEETEKESEFNVEDVIFSRENGEILHRAMEKIHPEYAALLRLVYFEGMSGEEACRVLGKSKRQVANITYRAKKALRRAMEEEGFSYEE